MRGVAGGIVAFRALACDYDGTLASGDRLAPEVVEALERARSAGLRLVLVTGRTFFELVRVCAWLDLFDAVVVENGAVVYFPAEGMIRDLAPSPPARLLAELDRRGVAYQLGRAIVAVARADEARVREALATAGVSLDLIYNRGALMLLPAGVSKGTGLQEVLRTLRLSFHDVLALGDAENDEALFEVCGGAGCPASAVPALRARADWVFPGEDGPALAAAIRELARGGALVLPPAPRHRVEVGWAVGTAEPVYLPARGVTLLIVGDPLAGKSYFAGVLAEHLLARRYALCVLDPEGDYRVLRELPGVAWFGITAAEAAERALEPFERDPGPCVVVDLSELPHDAKLRALERAFREVARLRRRWGRPHWVVLDEAHYALHREGVPDDALELEPRGFCLVTYRPSWLRPRVLAAVDRWVLARTTDPGELAFLRTRLGPRTPDAEAILAALPALPRGEFVLVAPGPEGVLRGLTFVTAPRGTPHVRHLRKYADSRVPPERAFYFRAAGGPVLAVAESLKAFRAALPSLPDEVLAAHAGSHDFSRWVHGVFGDRALALQLRKVEARWRRGEVADLRAALDRLIALRYGSG